MPLLATTQKRPKAPIELGNPIDRTYFFTPSDPTDPNSVHVAEVTEDDYDLLIKIDGYFAFRGVLPPAPAAKPAPVVAAPAVVAKAADTVVPPAAGSADAVVPSTTDAVSADAVVGTVTAETPKPLDAGNPADTGADGTDSAEVEAAATALLSLSWQALGAEIAKGGIPTAVAQRALDIELAKPEAEQKLTIVKKLKAALGVQ